MNIVKNQKAKQRTKGKIKDKTQDQEHLRTFKKSQHWVNRGSKRNRGNEMSS